GESVRFAASGISPGACRDRNPPDATLRAAGIKYSRGRLTLKGSASDHGCKGTGGLRSKSGHVSRVIVAVAKVNGSSCRFLQPNGKLTSARRCRKAVWLPARGTGHWRFSKSLNLPHGAYRATPRAYDASGNRSTRRGGVR